MKKMALPLLGLLISSQVLGQQYILPTSDGMVSVQSCYAWTLWTTEQTVSSRYTVHGYPSVDIIAARAFYVFDTINIPDNVSIATLRMMASGTGVHDVYAFIEETSSISTSWFDLSLDHPIYPVGFVDGPGDTSEMLIDVSVALSWARGQGGRYLVFRISCPISPQATNRDLSLYTSESEPDKRPRLIWDDPVQNETRTVGGVKAMFR